jgi:adenine deaminase
MFCSDDKHPDSLLEGHINALCARAVAKRVDLFNVLRAACINPVEHYGLDVGLLREGDPADFIIVKDLDHFLIEETYINGVMVAKKGETRISNIEVDPLNNFEREPISLTDLATDYHNHQNIRVIEALDGQLITNEVYAVPKVVNGKVVSDPENDILKIAVINRYKPAPIAIGFIRNFKLEQGALASSVAHDSHNIIAVGTDDDSLLKAINLVIKEKGGISCVTKREQSVLSLPVAGLMSNHDGFQVAKEYTAIDKLAKKAGSTLSAPFMTLSFMALLVIPRIKLSDLGLFDGEIFKLIEPV